jgi:adenylate cyclase
MAAEGTEKRRLAAIMFTDIVGYTAMTQRNEALTLEVLHEHRRLLRELFPKFDGREIETTGDGFLVEFESAVEAVRCAIEIQRTLATRNMSVTPERRVELRIGVHVGDVVHREGHILGDGVNIAARIQRSSGLNTRRAKPPLRSRSPARLASSLSTCTPIAASSRGLPSS